LGAEASRLASLIYSHGFSLRLRLLLAKPVAAEHLAKCGWSPAGSSGWVQVKRRQHLRGTAWLTQRRPRNRKLPLTKANEQWKTALYGVAVEEGVDYYYVDLSGVRTDDVDTFFRKVLEVGTSDYEVAYYRAAERYFVLDPIQAMRLAAELGHMPTQGRGRLTRKDYLVQEHPISMTVGKWAKATAALQVYRVRNGATMSYKVEVRLQGKKRDRHTFSERDIARLDAVLNDLIDTYHLHPIPKPDRWEPQSYGVRATVPFDPVLRRLPSMATRGTKLDAAVVRNCHTLATPKIREFATAVAAYPASFRISFSQTSSTSSSCGLSSLPKPLIQTPSATPKSSHSAPQLTGPWLELAKEIGSSRGILSEVILSPNQDPGPFIQALADEGEQVAITVIGDGSPTWASVEELAYEHRGFEVATTHVVVVDPTIVGTLGSAASSWDPVTAAFLASADGIIFDSDGVIFNLDDLPFALSHQSDPNGAGDGGLRRESFAVGGTCWNLLADLRALCEATGNNVVLVTVDTRPDHALTGRPTLKSHFFRDGLVRSLLGDAGRYYSHARYLVEHRDATIIERIVLTKDEVEGRTGRIIYSHAWVRAGRAYGFGSGRWRWGSKRPEVPQSQAAGDQLDFEPKMGIAGGFHPVYGGPCASGVVHASDPESDSTGESDQLDQTTTQDDTAVAESVSKPPFSPN
jgi:hypothetical protein